MAEFHDHVLLRVPPKYVFQFVVDVEMLPEFDPKVQSAEGPRILSEGHSWTETRRTWGIPRKRTFEVTELDKKARRLAATCAGATYTWEAKKGGTGSCNLHFTIAGDEKAVATAKKLDGDRLQLLRAYVED